MAVPRHRRASSTERHSMNPLFDSRLRRALCALAASLVLAPPAFAAEAVDEHAALAEKSSEEGNELANLVAVKLAYLHIDIPGDDAEAPEGNEAEPGTEGELLQRAGVA